MVSVWYTAQTPNTMITCCVCLEEIPSEVQLPLDAPLPYMTLCCGNVMHQACHVEVVQHGFGCPMCRNRTNPVPDLTQKCRTFPWAMWQLGNCYLHGKQVRKNERLGLEFQVRALENAPRNEKYAYMLSLTLMQAFVWCVEHRERCDVDTPDDRVCELYLNVLKMGEDIVARWVSEMETSDV